MIPIYVSADSRIAHTPIQVVTFPGVSFLNRAVRSNLRLVSDAFRQVSDVIGGGLSQIVAKDLETTLNTIMTTTSWEVGYPVLISIVRYSLDGTKIQYQLLHK